MLNNISSLQKNRVYAPILVGISLMLIVFFLYPVYVTYINNERTIESINTVSAEKNKELEDIKRMQALFASSGSDDFTQKVKKYSQPFSSAQIMESLMINEYTKSTQYTPASIVIQSLQISEGKKLPNGLSRATISLTLSAPTVDHIVKYLTYLTTSASYAFTLDTITLPVSSTPTVPTEAGISQTLSLGVYYYK